MNRAIARKFWNKRDGQQVRMGWHYSTELPIADAELYNWMEMIHFQSAYLRRPLPISPCRPASEYDSYNFSMHLYYLVSHLLVGCLLGEVSHYISRNRLYSPIIHAVHLPSDNGKFIVMLRNYLDWNRWTLKRASALVYLKCSWGIVTETRKCRCEAMCLPAAVGLTVPLVAHTITWRFCRVHSLLIVHFLDNKCDLALRVANMLSCHRTWPYNFLLCGHH